MNTNTFKAFLERVDYVTTIDDFEENKHLLQDVDCRLYDEFVKLLYLGAKIDRATMVIKRINRMAIETHNAPAELIRLLSWAHGVNAMLFE